jgi:protein disulfide-isomerase
MTKRILETVFFLTVMLSTSAAYADENQYSNSTPSEQYGSQQQTMMPPQSSSRIEWMTDYNKALALAKQTNKPILLFFTGSDWCGWCKKMVQEIFSSPEFAQAVGSSFIFVEVDFPMNKALPPELVQQNAQLKEENGVTGYPTVIIKKYINNNLTFIAETGYRPGGGKAYADYLNKLLQ